MRYSGGLPGQSVQQPTNPASGAPSSEPFNFLPTGPVPGGMKQAAGSNQYQNLPPWMSVGRPGSSLGPATTPQNTPDFNFQPIGPELAPIAPNIGGSNFPSMQPIGPAMSSQTQQMMNTLFGMQQSQVPGGANAIAKMPPQQQAQVLSNIFQEYLRSQQGGGTPTQYMGSFAQGGTVPTTNIPGGALTPVYGGSPIPAGGTNVPGGAMSPGYGLGVPQQGTGGYTTTPPGQSTGWTGAGGGPILGGGPFSVEQPADPNLTGNLFNYLQSQIGQGVTPFNLATQMPFGGTTQPGQLNAPANPILQNLMNFYQGKGQSNIPGMNTLATIANQGISALPEWQAMVNAQGQNISQNEAQLKEQFAGMGGLVGTPFGNAASNYLQGVTAQQNALLGQLQQQNILQGQIPAAEQLMGAGTQFGQYAQGLNQQAIQNMYNEFIRTSPQYNPLLQYQYGAATTYDPVLNRPLPGGGILGGIAGAAPGIMSTIAALAGLA